MAQAFETDSPAENNKSASRADNTESLDLITVAKSGEIETAVAKETPEAGKTGETCPANKDFSEFVDGIFELSVDPEKQYGSKEDINKEFACSATDKESIIQAVNALMERSPDIHDALIPEEFAKAFFKEQVESKTVGIGVDIQLPFKESTGEELNGPYIVEEVFEGGTAEKIGLQKGDQIIGLMPYNKADGTPEQWIQAERLEHQMVQYALNGPDNDHVLLVVKRGEQMLGAHVEKTEFEKPSITTTSVSPEIGVIKIHNFAGEEFAEKLDAAIKEHKDKKAIIWDVRDNPGGLLENAQDGTAAVVEAGHLFSSLERAKPESGRDSKIISYHADGNKLIEREEHPDAAKNKEESRDRLPYNESLDNQSHIVMINSGTGSSAEIFATVFDTKADTVGSTTRGKFTSQAVTDTDIPFGTAIKVTNGKILIPGYKHEELNQVGVKPDFEMPNMPMMPRYTQFDLQLMFSVQLAMRKIQAARAQEAKAE